MKDTPFLGARYFMGSVTNVANRPFRRLVTELGAEATIGEMAIAKYIEATFKAIIANFFCKILNYDIISNANLHTKFTCTT